MKKQLLFAYFICLILQVQSKIWAQDPISCIPATTANERIHFFLPKRTIIQRMSKNVNDLSFSNVQPIIDTLQFFADQGLKYDGVRFYFALSNNRPPASFSANTLYIVLVPTMATPLHDADNNIISDDDEDNAYIISNDALTRVNFDTDPFVGRWINRFNQVAQKIQGAYKRRFGVSFEETHSIWYSKRVIFFQDPFDNLGPDLLTYLKNQQANISHAYIKFASWSFSPDVDPDDLSDATYPPFSFKLSLVFQFTIETGTTAVPKTKNSFYTFQVDDMINNIKKIDKDVKISPDEKDKMIRTLKETYTDTGNPCPTKKCP